MACGHDIRCYGAAGLIGPRRVVFGRGRFCFDQAIRRRVAIESHSNSHRWYVGFYTPYSDPTIGYCRDFCFSPHRAGNLMPSQM